MKQQSMAERVRAVLRRLCADGDSVTIEAIALELEMIDRPRKPIVNVLKDMALRGEVERLGGGVVLYKGREDAIDVRDAMWSVLRMRKSVTAADLQELAGASKGYAREFLGMLVRRAVVERIRRPDHTMVFRLIDDPGPKTPTNSAKADRLRTMRAEKQKAIEQIEMASRLFMDAAQAIARARMAVNDIGEEVGDGDDV